MEHEHRFSEVRVWAVAILFLVPVVHPLLIPIVGVPSHLLWWVHVLPVALISYHGGRSRAALALAVSALFTLGGERLFGAGYGKPADWSTSLALTIALTLTNLLVAGFALRTRGLARRYQLLFDRAETGILRTGPDGRVLAANREAARMLGSVPHQILGKQLTDLPEWAGIPPLAALEGPDGWEGTLAPEPAKFGEGFRILIAAIRQEEPPGHQVLLVDRTIEAVQEAELERQGRLASLGEALAGVAHELKNPLAVIIGYGALVEQDREDDATELREIVRVMHEQAQRMHQLVQELLGYSRPSASSKHFEVGPFLRRILKMQKVTHRRGVRFVDRVQWDGSVRLSAGRLEQIVTNLLVNAADAVSENGGGTVELRAWSCDESLVIEIADDGPGISEELRDKVFLPFVTSKPEGKGTGLGLAISRRLAHSLGGSLTVRSRRSGGTAFVLALPLAREGHVDSAIATEAEAELFIEGAEPPNAPHPVSLS